MTESDIESALDDIFVQLFHDEPINGMLRFACDAEKNGIVASGYQGTAGAATFVLAIVLASCGWPT